MDGSAKGAAAEEATSKIGIINELHKQARKNFVRRKVYVKSINDLWQADLVVMKPYARVNSGKQYILTVIDVLSKYAWSVPVRTKSGKDVTEGMKQILKEAHPQKPQNLHTDNGTEFYNDEFQKLMKSKKINHYSTFTHLKASVVERFNRTLKSSMWKAFGVQGNYKWINLLPQLLLKYNSRVHRTIGMRPIDVKKKHEKELLEKVNTTTTVSGKIKFKINDVVRVSKYKTTFAKGYTPSWSTELFIVRQIRKTLPPVYYLRDINGDDIKGAFYSHEMQKTKFPDTYLVEKVLKRKAGRSYVKWLGFDNRHNSWI